MTSQQSIAYIENAVLEWGGNYSAWYIGITDNPKERLFDGHGVDKDKRHWAYSNAGSRAEADKVEAYFRAKGMKGGPSGGSDASTFAYVYRIGPDTRED